MFASKNKGRWIAAGIAVAAVGFLAWFWRMSVFNPKVYFLEQHAPAWWIQYPNTPNGLLHHSVPLNTVFHRSFVEDKAQDKALLTFRAMENCSISLNGVPLTTPSPPKMNWKFASGIDVSGQLRPGSNDLTVTVFSSNGPPTLWLALESGATRVVSDTNWECSLLGIPWRPAQLADDTADFGPGSLMAGGEQPFPSLAKNLPFYLVVGILCALVVSRGRSWLARYRQDGEPRGGLESRRFALYAIGALAIVWAALFLNNAGALPDCMGFDSRMHLDYIDYIKTRGRLPLANEGWQMYQPPLYHLISAVVTAPIQERGFSPGSIAALRYLGLCIGVAHFALIFLSLRLLFPARPGLQWFGLLLAAAMPENIYISSYITNEGLCGALTAGALYFCLRILKEDREPMKLYAGLGLCLGGALLAKVTAIIVVPFIGVVLLHRSWKKSGAEALAAMRALAVAVALVAVVCGWHYWRTWRHFGNPIIGNWDGITGFNWWMEHGFHTRDYFFKFGRALFYPWYSGFYSFADGVYSTLWGDGLWGGMVDYADRPPWNYDLMAAGYVLALLPMALIIAGAARALRKVIRELDPRWFLLTGIAFTTLAAMIYMALKLPSYGQVKAFYGIIALLPICAFATLAWEFLLQKWKLVFPIVAALFGVWAVNSYESFWIHTRDAETLLTLGQVLARDNYKEAATQYYDAALRADPRNLKARKNLAVELSHKRQYPEARRVIDEVLRESPDYAEAHSIRSMILASMGEYDAAIAAARKAVELAPYQPLSHFGLFDILFKLGRYKEAIAAGEEGLPENPFGELLHYKLGRAYYRLGDLTNAISHFRVAVTLKTDYADAREELGQALFEAHRPAEARDEFEKALRYKPGDTDLRDHLAAALEAEGRIGDAIKEYRAVLDVNPAQTSALNALAWLLSTQPDAKWRNGSEAVELATRACQLTSDKNALYLQTLAAAYAEAGRFDDAVAAANKALDLAKAAGDSESMARLEKMAGLFQGRQAYREAKTETTAN